MNNEIKNLSDRELIVRIYERVNNIKDDVSENKGAIVTVRSTIEAHIRNHKWLYMAGASMPPVAYYIIKLLEKLVAK